MLPILENVNTIEELMDVIDQPMFLLAVHGENDFEFRYLNKCHEELTGMDGTSAIGKHPHDILPERLADTIVSNYEKCRESGESYTYEEVLELPTGTRWWQTTLSPIKDVTGTVTKIAGLAFDISERKSESFAASQKIAEMTRLNEDLQVFTASSAQNMRGPFETMVALLDIVRDGFVDLGDEKGEQLALCQEIASEAIQHMSGILSIAQRLQVQDSSVEQVDLYHVAADNAALLDPHNRLRMDLPAAKLETDRVALQMVLRNVMDNAVRYADSSISISVEERDDHTVAIVVADDGVGQSNVLRCDGEAVLPPEGATPGEFGLASALAIVTARGGEIVRAKSPFATGAAIQFSLPGRILH